MARTLYSTNGVMEAVEANQPRPPNTLNGDGCSIALAKARSGADYGLSVHGPYGSGLAIMSRDELVLLAAAINRELAS